MTDKPTAEGGVQSDVNVNVVEATGVIILGFLFFIVLLALLRALKRERRLLVEVAELRAKMHVDKK
jgi:hypothetical protein